ncbi:hypothetical protein [Burkholderia pseudomallei]|nr:hypothetical protein [Burkholderia pseudomallei]
MAQIVGPLNENATPIRGRVSKICDRGYSLAQGKRMARNVRRNRSTHN